MVNTLLSGKMKWVLMFVSSYLIKELCCSELPLVVNTWKFTQATSAAWQRLNARAGSYLEAIVEGCSLCEREQCDGTVGFGGSPDEIGETTLDALIMDGTTMNIGAVAGLQNIKDAIAVAYHVLKYTRHTLLVGESATDFARMMGFKRESLQTPESLKIWKNWKESNCQPNYWANVLPDPKKFCGPYSPNTDNDINKFWKSNQYEGFSVINEKNHDTIGMIVLDGKGNVAAGTSTNGATHKIPGRVGDSPIPGAGAYADSNVGAAAATGDGDVMMRFLPSLIAVDRMRAGETPKLAAESAISRIIHYYPDFVGAIIVANIRGEYSAACHGLESFPYSIFKPANNATIIEQIKCLEIE